MAINAAATATTHTNGKIIDRNIYSDERKHIFSLFYEFLGISVLTIMMMLMVMVVIVLSGMLSLIYKTECLCE